MKRYPKGGRIGVKLAAGMQQRCMDSQGFAGSDLVKSFRTRRTMIVASKQQRPCVALELFSVSGHWSKSKRRRAFWVTEANTYTDLTC